MRSPDPRDAIDTGRELVPEVRTPRQRDVVCRMSDEDIRAMKIVGTFRTVNSRDIPGSDARRLIARGLAERKTVYPRPGAGRREVIVLTTKGRDLLRSLQPADDPQ